MKKIIAIIMLSAVCFAFATDGEGKKNMKKFLEVSKENPHYFVDLNGKTFIPIGLNLCFFRPGLYAEKINVEDEQVRNANFTLAKATRIVINEGLRLLGIKFLNEM